MKNLFLLVLVTISFTCFGQSYKLDPNVGFEVGKKMHTIDHDEIEVTVSNGSSSNHVEIALTKDSAITWWKGILDSNGNVLIGLVENHNGPGLHSFTTTSLESIKLGKAKSFGVYTGMYPLKVAGGFQKGKKYTFHWITDNY